MKALVTGGGGFLGRAIVRLLTERKIKVRSFSRSYYDELKSIGVKFVSIDLSGFRSGSLNDVLQAESLEILRKS